MAIKITYDVSTKQVETSEFIFVEHVKTEEEKVQDYKQKVIELISLKYSQTDELGLTNDRIESGVDTLEYQSYRAYVSKCKDEAYLEVYGVERRA